MSDPKDKKPADNIVAAEGQDPEIIGDEDLEQAEGGWGFLNTSFSTTKTFTVPGVNAETITANNTEDSIIEIDQASSGGEKFLRWRPGRIGPV